METLGTSLAVQWLRLCASTAGDAGLIPGHGTKIPHAAAKTKQNKTKQKKNEWKLFSPRGNAGFTVGTCRVKRRDWLNVFLSTPTIHSLSFLATVIILHSAQRWQSGRFVSLETPTDCGWILTCLSRQQSTLPSVKRRFLAMSKPFLLCAGVSCISQIWLQNTVTKVTVSFEVVWAGELCCCQLWF